MRISFIIFLLLLTLVSCKKDADELYDELPTETIYPSEYFPAYPGSYWNYINSIGDTIQFNTEPEYFKHTFSYNIYSNSFQTAKAYVPIWNGLSFFPLYMESKLTYYVYGNMVILGEYYDKAGKLFTTNVGEKWIVVSPSHTFSSRIERRVEQKYSVLNIDGTDYNDVILVADYWLSSTSSDSLVSEYYFAKNIGLIKSYRKLQHTADSSLKILSYYINY
jgi:hypothetical protein